MSKHTQGPWQAIGDEVYGGGRRGPLVACGTAVDTTREEDEANAAFIARACNCHEELLEALKEMTMAFDGIPDEDWDALSDHTQTQLDLAATRGASAIEKAEKGGEA